MKHMFIFILSIMLATSCFVQQIDSSKSSTKTDYLQKSKSQKAVAWLMLAGRLALVTAGSIVIASEPVLGPSQGSTGEVLFVAGIAVAAGSIPFFVMASKNKRRAVSTGFKMETAPVIQQLGFASKSFPAISIKLNL